MILIYYPNPNFEHYYELANFYKDNEYYEESIKYYSLALDEIEKNHFLMSKNTRQKRNKL